MFKTHANAHSALGPERINTSSNLWIEGLRLLVFTKTY
jgi:hypothetical protein